MILGLILFIIIVGLGVRYEPKFDKADNRWIIWYKPDRFSNKRTFKFLDELW